MSKPFIVVGDKIDHGGAVASSTATTDIDGKPVARLGDKVACSQHGDTVIASGDPTTIIDGQPVARHGDKTACGATLISGQVRVFVASGGGGGGGGRAAVASDAQGAGAISSASDGVEVAAAGVISSPVSDTDAEQYDEQIQFVNVNGAELAGVDYRISLESGEAIQGTTDAEGKTGRLATSQPTAIVSAVLSAPPAGCCHMGAVQSAAAPLTVQINATTSAQQLGTSVQRVATPEGKARGLTAGEIAMARLVFADSVDYSKVKVHNGEYLWFGMQPDNTAMTPNGEMYFNERYFEEDFSVKRVGLQHWFMHEMTHVWQHQLGYPVKFRGAVRLGLPYTYELEPGKRLGDYNMEAQGNILADYFLIKFRNAPGAIAERRYSSDPNALQLMETVLTDFLHDPGSKENLP